MKCITDGTVQAYLDGELTTVDSASVERHLAECPSCRARVDLWREALDELHADLAILDTPVIEVPDFDPNRQGSSGTGSSRESARITWLQSVIGVAAAAALCFVLFSSKQEPSTARTDLDRIVALLPPTGEDPQRMWREQAFVITVVDKNTGSVSRLIASSESDRVIRETFEPAHNNSEDTSTPSRGI